LDAVAADKAELAALLDRVHAELRDEAAAFPEALRQVRPTPEDWCAMELLGHVAEMHYSYVERAERLIAAPGAPLARDMESPERLDAIAQGPTLSLDDVFRQLEDARQHALAFLQRLTPDQMAIAGHHSALGPMTVRDVFARTIVGHARNHLEQLRATRKAVEGQNPGGGH
jgi:hypothetical protein